MAKIVKLLGILLIIFAFSLNPFFIEHLFSPDKKLDFLWKYITIVVFDIFILLFGLICYVNPKYVISTFKKPFIQSLLLLAFSIAFSLILIEGILYAIDYEYYPLDIKIKNIVKANDWREHHAFNDEDFIYDKKLLWRPKKNGIFNNQGFIGPVINHTSESYKVFVIGDSNTAGMKSGVSWPNYLWPLLKKDNENIVVINAGVWGYSSYQGLARFEETIPLNPDMVFVSFGSNDAHLVLIPDKDWSSGMESFIGEFPFSLFSNLRISFLLKSVKDKIKILSSKNDELVHRVSLPDYRNNLIEMINLAEMNDIKLIFLTRPFIYYQGQKENPDPNWWKSYGPDYNNVTVSVAKEHNITYFDVYSEFEDKNELFVDESHFTQEGYELMAEYIYKSLEDIGMDFSKTR